MKIDRQFLRNLILYGIIGAICAGVDALLFALLYKQFNVNEFVSNLFSVHAGIFLSFLLNSRYNFQKTDRLKKRFTLFYLTGLFGLGLSMLILFIGNQFGFDVMLTKIFSIVFVALVQFLINRVLAFGNN